MDCEKFDQHVMDALYDELDELTYAAMKRHMDSCARCASAFAGLRAARDVGALPLEEPSEDLEARILDAVEVAQKKTPFRRKALRALAWAGSHAMRPQLAMAALFVLVIGSSLLLLRPKTGMAPVRVTEWGQPASEQIEPPSAAAPTAFAAPAPEEGEGRRAAEAKASEAPRPVDAAKEKGERPSGDAEGGAVAAFREAQALQRKSGCSAALGKLDEVGALYPGTSAAHAAMWEAAQCYQQAGDTEKARELLLALRSTKTYSDRAERAIQTLDGSLAAAQAQNAAPATVGRAAAKRTMPAAAAPPPASAPAASAAPGLADAPPPAEPAAAERPSEAFDAAR
ncbi:anti-sigma factor family protein [Sorangium sp. So ce131]|uniref:anti-sigma factor family protein n=1 Tax=Sorangium sp. So ce131 TaxID=3133282 RepID=UPI003F62BC77